MLTQFFKKYNTLNVQCVQDGKIPGQRNVLPGSLSLDLNRVAQYYSNKKALRLR